jgi:hypothetical protein
MLIQDKPFKHWIDHFYGYGSWHAKIWFVAFEEGGGDLPEEVAEKFNYFNEKHASTSEATLCDIRELYRHVTARVEGQRAGLFTSLYDYRFGDHAVLHGLWKNLIAFQHGYRNQKLPDLLAHQKSFFALQSAPTEALIQLYPLPSPHNHAWYYSWLDLPQFPFLKSRSLYQQHLYQSRIQSILHNINIYKPEVVLMYGMDNINILKRSVQDFFPDVKFNMIKAIKQQIPQHHHALIGDTSMIITTQVPTLRHNRIETGFDWYALGKTVNGQTSQ